MTMACAAGGEINDAPDKPGETGGAGGAGGAGAGGVGGEAGGGGDGGEGGATVTEHGPAASGLVSAGGICESKGYRMVFTMGQSTINQNTSTSPSHRMQGGLIGATGSKP